MSLLVRRQGAWGHLTLDRPRTLNALTGAMCSEFEAALQEFAADPAIFGVLLDAVGDRAFCAGGDIRALHDMARTGDIAAAGRFFAAEYRLNARIARYPKPYVALMDGLTMGGGVGISAHGRHRVVTERTMLAMPEVGIGLIPDVGATWLLGRVPSGLGLHVALTALRLNAADAIGIDLADLFVETAKLPALRDAIFASTTALEFRRTLAASRGVPPPGTLLAAKSWIAPCYVHDSVEAILAALDRHENPDARAAATVMRAQSPTSLKLTLRALRAAPELGALEPCLDQEYRLALRCVAAPDFAEGVRAAVIDKDRAPRWSPTRLEEVDATMLDAYFAGLGDAELGLAATKP